MCRQFIGRLRLLCGHILDWPGTLKCDEAKAAGKSCCESVEQIWLGQKTRLYPCDDCIARGRYVRGDENWKKSLSA